MEQNEIGFITVAICGGYIGKYPRLFGQGVETYHVNILRPRQNGRNFPDDIFKCIFLNENI